MPNAFRSVTELVLGGLEVLEIQLRAAERDLSSLSEPRTRRLVKDSLAGRCTDTSRSPNNSKTQSSNGEVLRSPATSSFAAPDTPVEQPIALVIDDDHVVRRSLTRLLRSVGLDVATFASATDFLREPMPDRPSCVVLELCLPGFSGLELQQSLVRAGHEVPIIFISGHADVPSSVRAMKAGAIDFLQKPFSDQAVLDVVHAGLRRDREARRDRAKVAAIRQRFNTLSPRERDVLRIVIQGRLNKQIADELGISEKTVKFHRGNIMKKMQVGSLAELVHHADRLAGIGSPSRVCALRSGPAGSNDRSRAYFIGADGADADTRAIPVTDPSRHSLVRDGEVAIYETNSNGAVRSTRLIGSRGTSNTG
jgi:FixJ family two-component response regulator